MRLFRLREKLGKEGFILLEHGDQWLVTDSGVKNPLEKIFNTLEEVEIWRNERLLANNRLSEEEAKKFDLNFQKFVEGQNGTK